MYSVYKDDKELFEQLRKNSYDLYKLSSYAAERIETLSKQLDNVQYEYEQLESLVKSDDRIKTDAYDGYIVTDGNFEGCIGRCRCCGSYVASYICGRSVIEKRAEADEWDWWASCTNSKCAHHYGCGYFQEDPEWVMYDKGII